MSPAKPRTRTSAAEIRSSLIRAGRTILERDGEAGLTVRAVAAEAKVAPMGVYNHFDGRDGLLAHTYMLGANGQSNGCVSFRDYQAFLRAYQNGQVKRLVVVAGGLG